MQAYDAPGARDPAEVDREKHDAGRAIREDRMQHEIPVADYERRAQRPEVPGCAEKGAGNRC